jgi:plastocyanin
MSDDIMADLNDDLQKVRHNSSKAKIVGKELFKLTKKYTEIATKLSEAEASPIINNPDYALQSTIQEASNLLWKEMKEATKINKEFDHTFFTSRLRQVAYDARTIKIIPLKSGKMKVILNLDAVAGSLSDYGSAVRRVREEVKKFSKQFTPLGRTFAPDTPNVEKSHFWEEKFYKAAREGKVAIVKRKGKVVDKTDAFRKKYWETMHKRMDYSGKIAPFWEILDKGSYAMASKGRAGFGTAYPLNDRTDFTSKAVADIQAFYENQTVVGQTQKKAFNAVEAKAELKSVENDMNKLQQEFDTFNVLAFDPAAELLAQAGDRIEFVDMNKLNALADKIRAGEELPAGGSYIGMTGYKVRVRTGFIANSLAARIENGTY